MSFIFLSQVTTPVIGWIATLLGWIMNGVYCLLDNIGIANVGLSIILYTIIVYMCMYPLTVKQQKLSRMTAYIQPEISEIQNKYRGKRDQASQMAMNEEVQGVYAKYGVSPYGSCLPLIIQLPLLFALYGVIQNIPGYISRVANIFAPLATKIISIEGGAKAFAQFVSTQHVQVVINGMLTKNNAIDALYRLTPNQWEALQSTPVFSSISSDIAQVAVHSDQINTFAGINISESPISAIQNAAADGAILVIIGAILVPVLAWFTQWINVKLNPQTTAQGQSSSGMNAMNNFMPIFSAVICLTFSIGIGIYWIAGAVIRSVQMVYINRKMMKVNIEDVIAKNAEKKKEKMKKAAIRKKEYVEQQRVNQQARVNTRKSGKYTNNQEEVVDYAKNAANAHPESLTARANMVLKYDEEHPSKKTGSGKGSSGKSGKNSKKKK